MRLSIISKFVSPRLKEKNTTCHMIEKDGVTSNPSGWVCVLVGRYLCIQCILLSKLGVKGHLEMPSLS